MLDISRQNDIVNSNICNKCTSIYDGEVCFIYRQSSIIDYNVVQKQINLNITKMISNIFFSLNTLKIYLRMSLEITIRMHKKYNLLMRINSAMKKLVRGFSFDFKLISL